jgi:glycosyltransferase involved in cell wall biosynthesis
MTLKKKVGLITYTLSCGGVSTFVINLGQYLQNQGFIVDIITTEDKGAWFAEPGKYSINVLKKNIGLFKWLPLGRIIHSLRVGNFIRKNNYDWVIINYSFYAQASISMFKKPCNQVFSVIHNDNAYVSNIGCSNYNHLDAVVCVSPKVLQLARQNMNDSDKLHCILNGITLQNYDALLSRHSYDGSVLKLIYVGRISEEQKGVLLIPDIIKNAIDELVKLELTIVGDGAERDKLQMLFKTKEVDRFVTFTGNISREQVYKLYLENHIFLMTSYYEGLPLTLIESMASGCVPIVPLLENITDICISDELNGFLIKERIVSHYVEALKKVSNHPEKWNAMSKEAIKRASDQFSVSNMGKSYLDLFEHGNSNNESLSIKNNFIKIDLSMFSWKDIVPIKIISTTKNWVNKLQNLINFSF